MAVIDISYGTVYVRHSMVNDLWRRMEPGLDSIIREGADFLGDGGPWLPIGQEDAGGLIRAVAAYDLVERALKALEYEVERPESPWRREVNHRNVAEWATARIRHADEALRRSQVRVRELEDELANWRSSGWLRGGAMSTLALIADRSEMGGGDFLTTLGIGAFIVVAYVFAVWLGGRR
jgi:hypothetical protein